MAGRGSWRKRGPPNRIVDAKADKPTEQVVILKLLHVSEVKIIIDGGRQRRWSSTEKLRILVRVAIPSWVIARAFI